ncbi:hypothetical protein NDU88_000379 [Pleurodeles waltl]|uniref:Uncharacterized protein n=1 Tax=Pleurodeles waltl TaxID=8319 RepID=A0AAV7LUF6_PLEWA|nr:hypothetical protein NDU88_000379 [Pleurodeles waltl]
MLRDRAADPCRSSPDRGGFPVAMATRMEAQGFVASLSTSLRNRRLNSPNSENKAQGGGRQVQEVSRQQGKETETCDPLQTKYTEQREILQTQRHSTFITEKDHTH